MGIWDTIKGGISTFGPLLGPIGGVASTLIDAVTQRHANEANAANVDKQMAFQKEQSSTQYQRGVADMEAAGLNPGLAYQQGGASAQTGASATAAPLSQNTASKFATALDTYNQLANGAAQRDLMREQATAAGQSARLAAMQGTILGPEVSTSESGDYRAAYFKRRLAEQFRGEFENTHYPERFRADMAQIGAGTAQAQAAAAESRSRTTLNEQEFQTEWFRKNVAPYLNNTAAGIRAAGGLVDLVNPVKFKAPTRTTNVNVNDNSYKDFSKQWYKGQSNRGNRYQQ